jgi:hypothetical protein
MGLPALPDFLHWPRNSRHAQGVNMAIDLIQVLDKVLELDQMLIFLYLTLLRLQCQMEILIYNRRGLGQH